MQTVPYKQQGAWGFTQSPDAIESVRQFRDAAIMDGWEIGPTYGSEDVGRAASLSRDGWRLSVLTRENNPATKKWRYEASISIWSHDGLCVRVPEFYSWTELQRLATVCDACGKESVKTVRYSFAGRCCEACLPEMRKKHEQPDWCD